MADSDPKPHRLTQAVSVVTGALGSFPAIGVSCGIVALWALGLFVVPGGFGNDSYQLVINTTTTIITFMMVFIIQNTQNRDGRAVQVKLDALLKFLDAHETDPEARRLLGLEERPERAIKEQQDEVRGS